MKTGYTEAAGTLPGGDRRRDGVRLGVVVLNSPEPGRQAARAARMPASGRLPPSAGGEPGNAPGRLSRAAPTRRVPPPWSTVPRQRLTGQSTKGADSGSRRHTRAGRLPRPGTHLARAEQVPRSARPRGTRTRSRTRTEMLAARRAWQGKLAEGGLAGVTWPKEYGGQGLGPIEQVICNQEIARAGVPGILDAIGVGMLGPTIIAHGTDEQKSRYLGPMLHGDEVWCQLFSEPAAGSDLAAVQARARLQRRRQLAPERPEGLDDERAVRLLRPAARAHRPGRAQAQGPDDVHRADGRRGRDRPGPAPDLRRGRVQRGLLRRRRAGRRRGRRRRRQRLGHRAHDADVRARHDRPRRRGLGYNSDRFASRDRRRRARPPGPRGAPPARARSPANCSAVRFTGYRTLTALQQGQIPGPEAGLAKVTIVNGAIKAGDLIADVLGPDALEPDSEWAYMISFLPGLKSAGGTEEILRNTSASACSACRPSRAWTRASRSLSCAPRKGRRHEPRTLRRAGLPARGGPRRAVALQDARGGPRGARRRPQATARPLADRPRGRLARPADRRVARRRRARRLRRDARPRRVRPRARGRGRCSGTCRRRRCSTTRRTLRGAARQHSRDGEQRAAYLPGRPARDDIGAGWSGRPALGLAAGSLAAATASGEAGR